MTVITNRWKLGLFVVVGTAALVLGLSMFGVSRLQRQTHPVWAFFDEEVNGLESGSAVKFRGVMIGSVDDVGPAIDRRHIEVRMQWFDDKLSGLGLDPQKLETGELPVDMRAQIVTYALTQTAFVQVGFFDDGPDGRQKLPFKAPQATLPTVRGTYSSLEAGLRDVPGVLISMKALLDETRQQVVAMQLPVLAQRLRDTLTSLDAKVQQLQVQPLVDDGRAALQQLQQVVQELRAPDGALQRLLGDADQLVAQGTAAVQGADLPATAASLRQTSDQARDVAAEAELLLRDLRGELQRLRAAADAATRLFELLERDPGALLHGRGAAPSPLRKQ